MQLKERGLWSEVAPDSPQFGPAATKVRGCKPEVYGSGTMLALTWQRYTVSLAHQAGREGKGFPQCFLSLTSEQGFAFPVLLVYIL